MVFLKTFFVSVLYSKYISVEKWEIKNIFSTQSILTFNLVKNMSVNKGNWLYLYHLIKIRKFSIHKCYI